MPEPTTITEEEFLDRCERRLESLLQRLLRIEEALASRGPKESNGGEA